MATPIRQARSDWRAVVLVCGKCSKKIGGGFGRKGRTALAKALRKAIGLGKGRKSRAGIVETKCLGLCPKGAVTVVDTRVPGDWLIIPAGVDVDSVRQRLSHRDIDAVLSSAAITGNSA